MGALLAELLLPSPSSIGVRWSARLGLDPSFAALSLAMATQDIYTPDLLGIDGVVGTAVGLGADGTPVVLVYTARPGVLGLPVMLDGTPVRIEVTGEFWALGDGPRAKEADRPVDRRGRFPRPVPIGVSGGQPDVTAGTIGARVSDRRRTFALSNNHVFANRNDASRGDDILQPGRVDGGTDPANSIGTLHDFEPLRFCKALTCPENRVDAAIALTSSDNLGTSTPTDGYGEPRTSTTTATLGKAVQKYGRTTGLTTGLRERHQRHDQRELQHGNGALRRPDPHQRMGASARAAIRDLWWSRSRAAETTDGRWGYCSPGATLIRSPTRSTSCWIVSK